MRTDGHDRALAGLVDCDAELLYARLLDARSLEIGTGANQVDIDTPAARELMAARVAYRSPVDMSRLQAVDQATALQLLLARQLTSIGSGQQRLMDGWVLLDSVISASMADGGPHPSHALLAEIVTGRERLNRLAYRLQHSVTRELLGLSTGRFTFPINDDLVLTPPSSATTRGAVYRMIYSSEFAADPSGSRIIEESVSAGEQARIRPHLPLKMLHVDDRVALVALTETGTDGALLVHSPPLLAALREWFELIWDHPATMPVHQDVESGLTAAQRQVLRMLATGQSDETIARSAGMSVRTVRRHVTAILETLDAASRFAAGAIAAKRGWI